MKKDDKINLVKYWRYMLLGYMMLAWIIFVFVLKMTEWVLIPCLLLYLLISCVVARGYVAGMIGNIYYFFKKPKIAAVFYKAAAKMNTINTKALYNHALNLLYQGNPEDALTLFKRVQMFNTKVIYDKLIPLAISSCYWKINDIDNAVSTLKNLMNKYSYVNPNTLTTLAYFYILKGDYSKGEELTKKALEDNADYAPAWDNLGQIYYLQSDYKKAREYFLKALKINKNMTESLYYMGMIEKANGDKDSALLYLNKCLEGNISALSTIQKTDIEVAINNIK